jgi:hypothetical protein
MNPRYLFFSAGSAIFFFFWSVPFLSAQPFFRVWQLPVSGSPDEAYNVFQAGDDFVIAGHLGHPTSSILSSLTKVGSDGSVIWSKQYSKARMGYCSQTADGGYIFTGPGFTTAGSNHLYLLLVDSLGGVVWYRYLDLGTTYLNGSSVVQMADGGFVLVSQAPDGLMIRTDASGNIVFARYMIDLKFVSSAVLATSDGGYIVAGSAYQYGGASGYGIGLIKYNSANFVAWSRVVDLDSSDQFESVASLSETPEHNLVLLANLGYTVASIPANHVVMTKLTASGNLIWSKSHVASDTNHRLQIKSLLTVDPSQYVMAGAESDRISSDDSKGELWMCFTDSSGNPLISQIYNDSIRKQGLSSSLIQTATGYGFGFTNSGGPVVGGNDFGMLQTDAGGNLPCYSSSRTHIVSDLYPQVTNPSLSFSNASVSFGYLSCTATDQFPVLFSSCTATSVSPAGVNHSPSLQILPNPNTGNFMIHMEGFNQDDPHELCLYTLQGQLVLRELLLTGQQEIRSSLSPGTYFARLQGNQEVAIGKMIIVK